MDIDHAHKCGPKLHVIARIASNSSPNVSALTLAVVLLSGCVPYTTTYPKIEVADAKYFHPGCAAEFGSGSMAYYPFHGLYISIDLRAARFGLHIPSGTIVQLNGRTLQVDGVIGADSYKATFDLKATSHASIGTGAEPPEFMASIDHYTTPDTFGPLEGGGDGKYLLWYLYLVVSQQDSRQPARVSTEVIEGTVEVPSMTINGKTYESQKLKFIRERFVGLAAINC